jgi:zeaxanthin glucosyltransferase
MTTLILSPDFLSHHQPLAAIASALRRSGERVIMATGPAMRPFAEREGLEWRHLRLAAGSNDGVASATTHDPDDTESLARFVDATRRGFVAALDHQARKRRRELLWNPVQVGRDVLGLLDEIDPDHVIVDQVSLGSTLGLVASGRPFTTVVPGHPTQLPVAGEAYGDAIAWPDGCEPDPAELTALGSTVQRVNAEVTGVFNEALAQLTGDVAPVDDAFAVHGARVAYHWETDLHDPRRRPLLPAGHLDLGPLVRDEALPAEFESVVDGSGPLVLIAFGTFLVHRRDLVEAAMEAVAAVGARAVVSIGHHDPAGFGPVPDGWVLAPRIPQVALLRHADCLVNHGGNGSVQEALAAGVGQVLLPLSTDQMAIAADLVREGRARAADPNRLDIDHLAEQVAEVIDGGRSVPVPSEVEALVEAMHTAAEISAAGGPPAST